MSAPTVAPAAAGTGAISADTPGGCDWQAMDAKRRKPAVSLRPQPGRWLPGRGRPHGGLARSGARAEPRQSPGTGASADPPAAKGPFPMMYDVDLTVAITALSAAVLAAIYLWS